MNTAEESRLWFGTSGLVLPLPNKQAFPPEFRAGTRLTFYASLFNSLEVNSSFYKIPMPGTFSKWVTEVPEDFRFTVKLWQGITHSPQLSFNPADVDKFMHAANQLATKKGCLLIQLPPSLKADKADQLQFLLEQISQTQQHWRLSVEFRNRTWYKPEIEKLLAQFKTTRVLHDIPASKIMETTGDLPFIYLRFHGPAGDYKGGYGEAALKEYAEMIQKWQRAGKEVYVYFNNTIGDAITDLEILRELTTPNH
ncbi:MAG TPA: DUF72 domain-containing protein [Puia sp.]|jgi:uncharacterized protein YecE (DUF72 family)|nr:DUF72 domain-containing protein [Puia sp.]